MKEKVNPNHHMGKQTGYELIDGVYHIAPMYQEQFAKIAYQKDGIEQMVAMVTKHAAADFSYQTILLFNALDDHSNSKEKIKALLEQV